MATESMIKRADAQPDELRARLREMWSSVAGAWEAHADYVDTRAADVTQKMLELAAPQGGERVLELACGPGSVGLAAAERVAPDGEIVVSDFVVEMTSIAAARAQARHLDNVGAKVLDLEDIDEPDCSYDVVFCREGLMLVPDPSRAAGEINRVLRRGGRAVIAVWGPRERNPWLGIVFDTVSKQLGAPIPPPGTPHPFSLDDPERLAGVLRDGGLSDVVVTEETTPYRAASVEEWWERSCALAGPLAQRIAALPESAARALHASAAEAVSRYRTSNGVEFPGVTLVAAASRS